MDLDLTSDEQDVATTFERVLARESSIGRVREAEATGFDPTLWKVLTEMGGVGLTVPDSAGGNGGGFVELALVGEAVGRHLACVPFVEAAVAARVLAEAGGQEVLLSQVLAGGPPVVLSPRPAEDGLAVLVPGGAVAAAVVALDGNELVLAQSGAPADHSRDLGYLAAASRSLLGEGVDRHVLATGDRAAELWDLALGWWRVGAAAVCAGLAAEALEVAVVYARGREQFGAPIGSFQAIQQLLANAVMASDGSRLLAREAAWRYDRGLGSWRSAADIAFAHAAEAAVQSAEACVHVHGGYGFTLEYDPQLFLRRAKATQLLGGDPELIWAEIGAATVKGTH